MGLQVVLFSEPFTQGTLQMYFNLARSRQCPLGFLQGAKLFYKVISSGPPFVEQHVSVLGHDAFLMGLRDMPVIKITPTCGNEMKISKTKYCEVKRRKLN